MRKSIGWILLYFSLPAFCQQKLSYDFHHIDQTNGLLHNQVFTIAQDAKGYMWIGTSKGLQRYDGLRLKNYNDDLSGAAIQSKVQDIYADGNFLWLSTTSDIEKLDINTDKLARQLDYGQALADPSSGYDAYTDWDGTQYLLHGFEVYRFNPAAQKMMLYMFSTSLPFTTGKIARDETKKQIWVASPQGLLLFDPVTRKIHSTTHNETGDPLLLAMKGKDIAKIMIDSRHNIWMTSGPNDELFKYDPDVKKLSVYSLVNIKKAQGEKILESVLYNNCVFEDDHANIWVATQQAGLLKYNRLRDNFDYALAAKNESPDIEYNYNIHCIFQDNQENIWLGTDKGITVFNPYRNYFQTLRHQKTNPASLPKNEIQCVIQASSGDILAGTWGGGITVYDSTLKFKRNISIPGEFEKNLIWCFIEKDGTDIWAGCQHGFLHTYNTITGKITTIHPPAFESSTIRCMQKDKEGNIWFGLNNGRIAEWDRRSDKFLSYNDSASKISQGFAPVHSIFIDNKGRFWIGTEEGLKQFDPVQRIYTALYLTGKKTQATVSATHVQGIEEYNDSLLLIGAVNEGLIAFNKNNKSFLHIRLSDGLPSSSVYAIKKNADGNVWLTTDYNLHKFKPGQKGNITYAIDPGIINSSFESVQFYPLHDGRWVTSTSTEVFLFHPDSLSHTNEKAKIAITGFKLFDRPAFTDSVLDGGHPVVLNYQQNFITVEFSALSFLNIQRIRYFYRLSGVDKDWVNANTNGYASYTGLQPGHYIFSVKASDEDDAPVTSMYIVITPPWYRTWWFVFICIAVAGFLIYRWIKTREKNIKTRMQERSDAQAIIQQTQMQLARQQHKMAEAEMNALRAQMNPHFIFNSLNSINNYILKNDADNAAGYLTKFSRLMRLILDNSRSNWVWLQSELKALQLYAELEAFRFDHSFTYKINIDNDVSTGHIMVPPMIIQPYMENAIWHGLMHKKTGGGHLEIHIYKEAENLCISIKDNGVGRESSGRMRSRFSEKQKSYGMKITSERLEIMNKVYDMNAHVSVTDAEANGGDATGTIVLIKFRYTLKNGPVNV